MTSTRHLTRYLLAILTLGLASCNEATRTAEPGAADAVALEPGVSLSLARHRASVISDLNYRLNLSLPRDRADDIPGTMVIEFRLADATQALQVDFREDAERLLGSRINGSSAAIELREEHLTIPRELLHEGSNTLEFEFLAGNSSLNRNPDFLYTLFVPDRARTAFPVFDQPDLKATWELILELPADWTAISGAPIERTEAQGERQTLYFGQSDLISSYLFSFVAGAFKSITREVHGQPMTLLHRETDAAAVARNADEIFRLHAVALQWLEDYTGIPHPYGKLDFALLPSHPYGGMEHVGAIQYRAERLWLDEGASETELLNRASLIAHEVAHMWFGNLVTMRWFNDVWTKEVFANFMAAKIVNPSFPTIDHELGFLVDHHPGAYSIDRTAGANPIRQPLANLNQAGQLYGPIIYEKAPIMMRQLELLIGERDFRDGIREYLRSAAHGNSSWPELIEILDRRTNDDVSSWSKTWVNTPGRPVFQVAKKNGAVMLTQSDPDGAGRLWPQQFTVSGPSPANNSSALVQANTANTAIPDTLPTSAGQLVYNANGYGYGLFPVDPAALDNWQQLSPLPLASLLISSYEQMLEGNDPAPADYLGKLLTIAGATDNQLLMNLALGQLQHIYWNLITAERRAALAPDVEGQLWRAMETSGDSSVRKIFFNAFANLAVTTGALKRVADVWSGDRVLDQLPLAERDYIRLAQLLAIKDPERGESYLDSQLGRTENPDQQRRLRYLMPSLSAEKAVRDAFFASLADEKNRETESWVLSALNNLHHPLRTAESVEYLLPSLELLEEIQKTGDIFFPAAWLNRTLRNHHSEQAVSTIENFLGDRPDYNPQLRMKILQAADPMIRSRRLRR